MTATTDQRFKAFVLFQAQNAGLFLGQIPHPATGEKGVNLKAAESVLDSLEMLNEKSEGNLTVEEAQLLGKVIDNIRHLIDLV